ncbi:IS1 family transposase [Paenibacillus thiaminolyticus]|uniref:IS1 family transposase n=1 Tax=Paenibacillus thiaminolyticus TaxID=49283 RepID=UPI0011C3A2EB|nr:IS1 family transposase [Paenibacillus thiaminolyticus]
MATIEQIRTDIERLDQFGKERVFAWLKTTLTPLFESKSIFHEVNERKANKGFRCIYCGMDEIVRFGKTGQDRQRYKCKCCDKTFTETADTPLYHCRKSEK